MPLRARLLRLAQRFLGPDVSNITIVDRAGGVMNLSFPPEATAPELTPEPPLREVERNLMEAATDEPQNGEEMARAAGYADGSYVRAGLASLVKKGKLVHVHGGYRLPEK